MTELNERLAKIVFGCEVNVDPFECWSIRNNILIHERIVSGKDKGKDGKLLYSGERFTTSMDACLKLIVPELPNDLRNQIVFVTSAAGTCCALAGTYFGQASKYDFALAFCLAADKKFSEANHV